MKFKALLYCILGVLLAYTFIEFMTLKFFEPLKNVNFFQTSAGSENIPVQWVLGGAGVGTVFKDNSKSRPGKISIKIVQTSGNFIALYQDVQHIKKARNRKYSFGCWINTASPGSVRLVMGGSEGAVFSKFHSGSGKWEYLTLNGILPSNAKYLRAHIWLENNASAYVEEVAVDFTLPARVLSFLAFAVIILLVIISYFEVPFIRNHTLAVSSKLRLSNKEIPYLRMRWMPLSFVLIVIIFLAFTLRFVGLGWGIPTSQIPHALFQCDEQQSILAAGHVDFNPQHIDLNTQNGHLEGSLTSYIFNIVAAGLKGTGIIDKMPHEFKGVDDDYSTFLYASRMVSVVSDLLSILIIFVILRAITRNDLAALMGASLFAIIPFEVIHAHYMRTHSISNLFIVLMIYISLHIYRRNDLKLFALLGLIAGGATAIRYPVGIIITIPMMMLFYRNIFLRIEKPGNSLPRMARIYQTIIDPRIFIIVIFWFVGFFMTDPTLFLNFKSVQPSLELLKDNTATSQFNIKNIFDLSRIWEYIIYLIPFGTFPFLWIIFYLSFVSVFFIKKYYQYTIPLCLFTFLYLYPMAKGYSAPIYIRAVMPLFPIFSILSAIALTFLLYALKKQRVFYYCLIGFFSLVCLSTIVYSGAYSIAMSKEDPRIQLYHYLNSREIKKDLVVGITNGPSNDFLTQSTLSILPDKSVLFIKSDDFLDRNLNLDYVLLYSNFWIKDNNAVKTTSLLLKNSDQYVLDKIFENGFLIFGVDITYPNFFRDPPVDLQFPFPKLYLFKRVKI